METQLKTTSLMYAKTNTAVFQWFLETTPIRYKTEDSIENMALREWCKDVSQTAF